MISLLLADWLQLYLVLLIQRIVWGACSSGARIGSKYFPTNTIAKDMMPFTAVERSDFKKMLSAFDQRYELPGRKYFSQTAIPSLYSTTREKVESELQKLNSFRQQQTSGQVKLYIHT